MFRAGVYKKADNYPLPALMVKSLHRTLITEYRPNVLLSHPVASFTHA
jgi:hypothetical protein